MKYLDIMVVSKFMLGSEMREERISIEEINRIRHSLYKKGDDAKKVVELLVTEEIFSESNDYMLSQYALIAGYYWSQGMTEEGKQYIQKAMQYCEYAVDRVSVVDAYVLAGNYATIGNNLNEGMTWYLKALKLSETIEYKGEIARIYNNIGSLFLRCENYDRGLNYLLEAEKYSKRFTDVQILCVLYNNIAETYLKLNKNETACHYIELMESHVSQHGTVLHRISHLLNKWRYALNLGDVAQAEAIAIESSTMLDRIPYGNEYAMNMLFIFDLLVKMEKSDLAIWKLERYIAKLEIAKDYYNLKKYYNKLIDYYEAIGDLETRSKYINKNIVNEHCVERENVKGMGRTLVNIDDSHRMIEKEREKAVSAYTALNDVNSRLQAMNNNLKAIHSIGIEILSTTDLEEIYEILLAKVNSLFQVKQFAIGILNKTSDALIFKHSSEKTEIDLGTRTISLEDNESISIRCFNENKEIIINDCMVEDPERYYKNLDRGEKLSSLFFIPIIIDDKPFGVITVQHAQKYAFSTLHFEVFRLLATFAAVSFKNAQHNAKLTEEIDKRIKIQNELEKINERLNHLARHDDLTGVFNRRTFEKVYDDAFSEVMRKGGHLSVMILDIDHFKEFNDYYGHLKGDKCIIQVANILKDTLKRKGDIVARYGGDEFMVLLPETDAQGAIHVAEKLVEAVRQLKISHEKSYVSDVVTISLGIASWQNDLADSDALLIAADKALYHAKKKLGKNVYYLWQ